MSFSKQETAQQIFLIYADVEETIPTVSDISYCHICGAMMAIRNKGNLWE
jgi:hypothetical protein